VPANAMAATNAARTVGIRARLPPCTDEGRQSAANGA